MYGASTVPSFHICGNKMFIILHHYFITFLILVFKSGNNDSLLSFDFKLASLWLHGPMYTCNDCIRHFCLSFSYAFFINIQSISFAQIPARLELAIWLSLVSSIQSSRINFPNARIISMCRCTQLKYCTFKPCQVLFLIFQAVPKQTVTSPFNIFVI